MGVHLSRTRLRQVFKIFDSDGDGVIDCTPPATPTKIIDEETLLLLLPLEYTPNTYDIKLHADQEFVEKIFPELETDWEDCGTASARDRTHATPPSNALPLLREDPSGTPPPSVRGAEGRLLQANVLQAYVPRPLFTGSGPLEVRPSAPRCECFLRVAISTSPALRQTTTVWRPLPRAYRRRRSALFRPSSSNRVESGGDIATACAETRFWPRRE
eukprot:scaffold20900_cov64-Phaeocystis_antarctica.AAC.3